MKDSQNVGGTRVAVMLLNMSMTERQTLLIWLIKALDFRQRNH